MKKKKIRIGILLAIALTMTTPFWVRRVTAQNAMRTAGATKARITYHEGPVMEGTSNVYFIWYGDWSVNPLAVQLIGQFVATLGGSPYLLTNTTYPDSNDSAPESWGCIFWKHQ